MSVVVCMSYMSLENYEIAAEPQEVAVSSRVLELLEMLAMADDDVIARFKESLSPRKRIIFEKSSPDEQKTIVSLTALSPSVIEEMLRHEKSPELHDVREYLGHAFFFTGDEKYDRLSHVMFDEVLL